MSAKPKKAQRPPDWHKADIVCALHKAGWSLRRLSLHHGYKVGTVLHTALHRPYPKGERLIAAAIGVDPADIWPSRYQDSTTRTRRASDTELAELHQACADCIAALVRCYQGGGDEAAAIEGIDALLARLVWHRENLGKLAHPELDLDGGEA